jgi:hypothetical protein
VYLLDVEIPLGEGDAHDLACSCRCGAVVGDVEAAVGAKGHAGWNGEPGGYLFDIADAIKAYNLAIARGWEAGSGRELKRIEETIRAEVDGDNCGEASARSREAKFLELVATAENRRGRARGMRRC